MTTIMPIKRIRAIYNSARENADVNIRMADIYNASKYRRIIANKKNKHQRSPLSQGLVVRRLSSIPNINLV